MPFERTQLACGIRVVTARMPGQRSAAVGAWIGTGSRDEPAPLAGVTHFLEHLVFKGTPTRSALEIAQAFDAIGGDLNAFTTKEFTCFHARTLVADVPVAVETIADMLRHAQIAGDDVEAERSVILEEIAMHEDTPDDVVFDLFHESVWGEHPLARRVQGYERTLAGMPRDEIDAFYRARYRPADTVVAAVGAVDHATFVALVERAFDGAPPAAPAPLRADGRPPAVRGALEVRERDIEQTHVVYGTAGIARADERRWALGVLNTALGGGMSSRLFQEVREKRGLAYAVSSGHQGYAETGIFTLYAGCSPENAPRVLEIMRGELDAVVAQGIDPDELDRAIGHLRGNLLVSLDDGGAMMSHLGQSELTEGRILRVDEMLGAIEGVTGEDVRSVAREVLVGQPWSLTLLGPAPDADLSGFVGVAA